MIPPTATTTCKIALKMSLFNFAFRYSSIFTFEAISEDDDFKAKELAAAVASKCFYHLEEYEDALRLALASGKLFDVNSLSEYSTTMVGKCIEAYVAIRNSSEDDESKQGVDVERLEAIVEGMFARCYKNGTFRQALGIALEAGRLDRVKDALVQSGDQLPVHFCFTNLSTKYAGWVITSSFEK